ncbi:hypothetical protein GGI42DRAFT_287983 [Trichoderma sp. SZMC 28013]
MYTLSIELVLFICTRTANTGSNSSIDQHFYNAHHDAPLIRPAVSPACDQQALIHTHTRKRATGRWPPIRVDQAHF